MSTRPPTTQIIDDNSCLRIVKGNKTMLVGKEQIKTIDTVHEVIVRIDIGEGPLKNIFINYQDVTNPTMNSADELRDLIRVMLISDQWDGEANNNVTEVSMLNQLVEMTSLLQGMNQQAADITKLEPIFVDESNPNSVYKGWARTIADSASAVWAIEKISRVSDIVIYEWADGNQLYDNVWDNRLALTFTPYLANPIPE